MIAHSLSEAYFYLMATSCTRCGQGPLRGADAKSSQVGDGRAGVSIAFTCRACGAAGGNLFQLPAGHAASVAEQYPKVNPTDEPSRILDVAQWLTLFRMITQAASTESDKVAARQLGLEAAQCLEEALKFYDDSESDLPPRHAFFHEASRSRYQLEPQQFSRRRLLDLRSKLPTTATMRSALSMPKKRRWWGRRK